MRRGIAWLFGMTAVCLCGELAAAEPDQVPLASGGEALHPVVVGENASDAVHEAAEELAHQLRRISGAEFDVTTADGTEGLAVGVYTDFPRLDLAHLFDPDDMFRREEYLLRSHGDGVFLVGATELAVRNAVWDFLHRLGYRQFFPGETWEVVPELDEPDIAVDSFEAPDFYQRLTRSGHGLLNVNRERVEQWRERNRFVSALSIPTSHYYQRIVRRNQEVFDENPEYLALVDGERKGTKLCISNDDLRELVVEDAKERMRDNPEADGLSMEPSDGGGWCECDECAELGSISDRAVILANEVAEAIQGWGYGPKYVGLLAYHMHSPPPNVEVHPNVFVRAATNSVTRGYTHQELLEGWREMGATLLGVFDLYSVHMWDQSLPAAQKGSNIPDITDSLLRYYRTEARLISLAHSDNWGPSGLGMYIASRILWDTAEAERVDELFDDFLKRAFGPARKPMEEFFRQIYLLTPEEHRPLIREDMLGRMYRALDRALERADSEEIRDRIDHLILYTRYADLIYRYREASGGARKEALKQVLRHAWRIRETHMVHTRPIMVHLMRRDGEIEEIPDEEVRVEDTYARADIEKMLRDGIETNEVVEIGFEPREFSRDLVPATPLDPPEEVEEGSIADYRRGRHSYYFWMDEPGRISFQVSGGHIEHFRHIAGNVEITLTSPQEPTGEPVDFWDEAPPDGERYPVELKTPYEGLHRLEIEQHASRVVLHDVPDDISLVVESSLDEHLRTTHTPWSLYFYVPHGTEVVGGFTNHRLRGEILDGDGETVFNFRDMKEQGYFKVPVPEGQDGRFWKISGARGHKALLTVPPFMAHTPAELLLPREVVEADSE